MKDGDEKDETMGNGTRPADADDFLPSEPFRYKIVNTVFIVCSLLCMGLCIELIGPTLKSVSVRLGPHVGYQEISRGLMAYSVGALWSSLASGLLADLANNHIKAISVCGHVIGAAGTLMLPWSRDLWTFALSTHLQGIGLGTLIVCLTVLTLKLWGEKASVPINALHAGYGVGAIIAPQLCRPFLETPARNQTTDITLQNETGSLVQHGNASYNHTSLANAAPIEIPYTIASLLLFVMAILQLGTYVYDRCRLRNRYKGHKAIKPKSTGKNKLKEILKMCSPGSCTDGSKYFGALFFTLFFVFFWQVTGIDSTFGKYLFSFSRDANVSFTISEAVNLQSAYWFTYAGGRIAGTLVSIVVPGHVIIAVLLTLGTTGGILLTIYGSTSAIVLWVCAGAVGLAIGPLPALISAWANIYVDLKGMAVGLGNVGAFMGSAVYIWLAGTLYQSRGPGVVMQVVMGGMLAMLALFGIMYIVAVRRGGRRELVMAEKQVQMADDKEGSDENFL